MTQTCFIPLLVASALLGAGCGHRHRPPLPSAEAVIQDARPKELPRAYFVVTGQGAVDRGVVLEGGNDRHYRLSMGAFVLAWPDGRLLLLDTGSDEAATELVGGFVQLLAAARGPFAHTGDLADALGARASDVRAVVFSHLHTDHTGGLKGLCAARGGAKLAVHVGEGQADDALRSGGLEEGWAQVEEAGCAELRLLPEGELVPIEGFPGVRVLRAAGHTNGSLVVVAHVLGRDGRPIQVAFAGDILNALESLSYEPTRPKPWFYRAAFTEDEERLAEVRALLKALAARDVAVAPAHDLLALRALAEEGVLTPWPPASGKAR